MRRRVTAVLAGSFLVLLFVWTGAYAFFNDDVLGEFISAQVNRSERGRFLLGKARFSYLGGFFSILTDVPTRVVGEDYRLLDPDGTPVLQVPYVEAEIHLQSLIVSLARFAATRTFHLTLHFSRAWVPTGYGVITATRSSLGHANEVNIVAAMSAKKKSPPDGGELRIQVDALRLGDIGFALAIPDAKGRHGWYGRLDHATGEAALVYSSKHALETPEGPHFFFKIRPMDSAQATLKMGDFLFPLEKFHAIEFGPDGKKRQDILFKATARTLGAELAVEGALTDAYSKHPGVQLTLDFKHGIGPARLLPQPLAGWLGGDPEGTLRIRGPFSNVLIEGDVRKGRLSLDGLVVDDAATRFKLGADTVLKFDSASGKVAGGALGGSVDVGLGKSRFWRARLTVRNVDPSRVPQLPKELRAQLAGRLDGSFRMGGSLDFHPERIRLSDIDATLERAGNGRLPKKWAVAGGLEISPERVTLDDFTVGTGGVTLAAFGAVDPKSGRLDARLHLDGKDGTATLRGFGVPSQLRLGSVRADGKVSGTWPRPSLSLQASATGLGWLDRTLDKLDATLALEEGVISASAITATGMGGQVEGEAEIDLFEKGDLTRPKKNPEIKARLDARGVSVARLFGTGVVAGGADFHLSLDGPLGKPRGEAIVMLPAVTLYGDPYRKGRFALAMGDGVATVKELSLERVKGGTVTGSGQINSDSGGDLNYVFRLNPKKFPVAAIPNVAKLPFTLAGTLEGDLSIEGDPDRWMPGGSIALTGFRVREAVLGDGKLSFEPGGDASRVTGQFFKNFSVEGNLTPFPKLALNVTIKFNDLALENIFPEMQKLADVTGKASGEARIVFNLDSGLTAALTLSKLELTLEGTEDDGRARHLVVTNREPVVISSDGEAVRIRTTRLTSALGDFVLEADTISAKMIDARMRGQIGLELLEYFFREWFEHTDGNAFVDLTVKGHPESPRMSGTVDLRKVRLVPKGLEHALYVRQGHVEFTEDEATLSHFTVEMDKAIAQASGSVQLDGWKAGAVNGQIDGELSARILQWIAADQIVESSGRLAVNVRVDGQWSRPRWQGMAKLNSVNVQVRRFDHQLAIASGTIDFQGYEMTLGCPRPPAARPPGCLPIVGQLDGTSPAEVDGLIGFGEDLSFKKVDVQFAGTEIRHTTPQYTLQISPRVRLQSADGRRFALTGNVNLVDGRYTQKFEIRDWVVKPRSVEIEEPFWEGDPRFETMRLGVHVQSTGPLYIKSPDFADLTVSSVVLDVSGTLSEPRLDGDIRLEEGGTINVPLVVRIPLVSEAGLITFQADKRIPDETPLLDLRAKGACIDRNDTSHPIELILSGTIVDPRIKPYSPEGWDQSQIATCLVSGRTSEDLRRFTSADPSGGLQRAAVSTTEGVQKAVSGTILNEMVKDPLRKVFGFDTTSIELGGRSVDIKACYKFGGRWLKICGQGEIGFLGGSKVQGQLELRLADQFSTSVRGEHLTQGIETLQQEMTRFRLELKLGIPLGY